jgi:multicomponent Na+:H+ antiporter subunit B
LIRQGFTALAIAFFGIFFAGLAVTYTERTTLPPLAKSYLTMIPDELGTPNTITGILLALRGFDTLGEVAVLFMVAAGVGLVLQGAGSRASADPDVAPPEPPTASTEIVQTGAEILLPLISIFAVYIIMNGHLSAGGGFQGGAVIASAVLLVLLARPEAAIDLDFLSITESIAGVLFVLVGITGLMFAGGFLDNRVLPLGQFGAFFSAGAIPVISVLLGVKVGCELCVIVDRFRG